MAFDYLNDPLADQSLPDPITSGEMPDPIKYSSSVPKHVPMPATPRMSAEERFNAAQARNNASLNLKSEDQIYRDKSLVGAGVDMGQAMMYRGASMFADLFSAPEMAKWFQEQSDVNLRDATMPPERMKGLTEKLAFATGTLASAVPLAVGAAIAAPMVGLSVSAGAYAGGILASLGLNAGDLQFKKDEATGSKEAHPVDWRDAVTSIGLTIPDMFAVGKLSRVLKPLGEAVVDTATATHAASRGIALAKTAGKVGTTAVTTGAIEAGQDLASGYAALVQTETEINESRKAALAQSFKDEFIVGSLLGVPLGGLEVASEGMSVKQNEHDLKLKADLDAKEAALSGLTPEQIKQKSDFQTPTGEVNPEVFNVEKPSEALDPTLGVNQAPVEGAAKQPGMWSLGLNVLMGNATANIRLRNKNHAPLISLLNQFNIPLADRIPGAFTIQEKANHWFGEFQRKASTFFSAPDDVVDQVVEDRMYSRPSTEHQDVREALDTLLGQEVQTKVREASRGKIDVSEGLFARQDYVPIALSIDDKRLHNDPNAYQRARDNLNKSIEAGTLTQEEANKTLAALRRKASYWKKHGTNISYATQRSAIAETKFIQAMKAGDLSHKKMKHLVKAIGRKVQNSDNKQSPLTLERELGALTQDFWAPYYRKNLPKKEVIRSHIKMVSEHLAHIDTFGVDNHLFDEAVAKSIVWGHENNMPIAESDIVKLYDLLKVSQRIPTREMNPTLRAVYQRGKAITNMMLLGTATLVSIPESLIIALNTGSLDALKGLAQTVRLIGNDGSRLASNDLGMGLDHAMSSAVGRLDSGDVWNTGPLEEGFFKLSGIKHLQHFLSIWAARSQDVYIRRKLQELTSGSMTLQEKVNIQRKLHQAGINIEAAQNWRESGYSVDSPFFRESYVPAIQRLVRDTIVEPTAVDKPLWMSDPRFMLVAQLKGFMTAFTNRVMMGWASEIKQQGPQGNITLATRLAPYTALYLAAQIGIQAVREIATKGDLEDWDQKSMAERVWNSFGYLGSLGWFVDLVNHFRYKSDPMIGNIPALSIATRTIGDAVRALEATDPEKALLKVLTKNLLPTPVNGIVTEAIGLNEQK